jgi:DNA-binding Lrp family transcriptional regulator
MNGTSRNAILVTLGVVVTVTVFSASMSTAPTIVVGFGTMVCVQLLNMLQTIAAAKKVETVKMDLANSNKATIEKTDEIADEVNTVKTDLKKATDEHKVHEEVSQELLRVGKETNEMVKANGADLVAYLKLSSEAFRRLYGLEGKPTDLAAAEEADKRLVEHSKKAEG